MTIEQSYLNLKKETVPGSKEVSIFTKEKTTIKLMSATRGQVWKTYAKKSEQFRSKQKQINFSTRIK